MAEEIYGLTERQGLRLGRMLAAFERGELGPGVSRGPDPRWLPTAVDPVYLGKLDANLSSGSTGTLSIYSDATTDTGDNLDVENRTGKQLKTGVLMKAFRAVGWENWLIEPYELEDC